MFKNLLEILRKENEKSDLVNRMIWFPTNGCRQGKNYFDLILSNVIILSLNLSRFNQIAEYSVSSDQTANNLKPQELINRVQSSVGFHLSASMTTNLASTLSANVLKFFNL